MNATTPEESYSQEHTRYKTLLAQLQKKRRHLGWIRLAVFLVMLVAAYQTFTRVGVAGLIPTVIGIGLLLYLVSVDVANNKKIRHTKTLIRLCQ
jgi:uncharacterized membrane protein YkgB